ncbi:MAG: hypothetical protein AAFP77_06640 [Bacteroidota bacterium]
MKKPTQAELQQKLNQVTNLLESVQFEQVISWVYAAPDPKARSFSWWWKRKG